MRGAILFLIIACAYAWEVFVDINNIYDITSYQLQ